MSHGGGRGPHDEQIVSIPGGGDNPAGTRARLVLEALRKVGFDPKRLKLALNRSNAFTGISVGAAESALKREFETKITNEYRVAISAQNTGSPFSYSKPDSPLSKEIVELAHAIDASFAPQVAALSQYRTVVVADHTRSNRLEQIARDVLAAAPPRFALVLSLRKK